MRILVKGRPLAKSECACDVTTIECISELRALEAMVRFSLIGVQDHMRNIS